MACQITFNIQGLTKTELANGNYTINDINLENYSDIPELSVAVQELLKSKNSKKLDKIIEAIKSTLLTGQVHNAYDANCRYIPNYLGEALKEAFPSLQWGDNVPDVLLINSDSAIPYKNNGTFLTKVIQYTAEGNYREMYIVPVHLLEAFAAHTRALTIAQKLGQFDPNKTFSEEQIEEACEHDRLKEIYDRLISIQEKIKKDKEEGVLEKKFIKDRYKKFYAAILSLIESLLKTLNSKNNLPKLIEQHRTKAQELLTKRDLLDRKSFEEYDEYRAEWTKINSDMEYENLLADKIEEVIKTVPLLIYSWTKMYVKYLKNSEQHLGEKTPDVVIKHWEEKVLGTLLDNYEITDITTDEMDNQKTIKHRNAISEFKSKQLPSGHTVSEFITLILQDYDTYTGALSFDMIAEIEDIIHMLADENTSMTSSIPVVNTINWQILTGGNKVSTTWLKKYFSEKYKVSFKGDVGNSLLYSYIQKHFIENLNKYYVLSQDINKDTVLFRTHKLSITEELGLLEINGEPVGLNRINSNNLKIVANKINAIKPIQIEGSNTPDIYRGFYMYCVKGKYFYSRDLLSIYTKSKLFDSYAEMKEYIDEHFNNINLGNEVFIYGADISKAVKSPIGRFYKTGQILQTIDFKPGSYKIPRQFTIGEFKAWLNNTFDSTVRKEVIDKLKSPEAMALFYTHYRLGVNYHLDSDSYIDMKDSILKTIDDIVNAPIKYYTVSDDTYAVGPVPKAFLTDHRTFYTRLSEVPISESENIYLHNNSSNFSIIDWNAVKTVFNKHGVNVQLVTSDELKERHISPNTNGYLQGGIIYINTDRASMNDAFHEYTHLLLGILKSRSFESYNAILLHLLSLLEKTGSYKVLRDKIEQDYAEELNLLQNSNPAPGAIDAYINEEIFCDQYGAYLLKENFDLDSIFDGVSEEIANDSIFNNLTAEKLRDSAKNKFGLMFLFSTEMRRVRNESGFGLYLEEVNLKAAEKKIEKLIKEISKLSLTEEFDLLEEGLYKYCD